MRKSFHTSSFLTGAVTAILLFSALGAANQLTKRYDAEPTMGGLGIQIVDHDTNMLHNYRRTKVDGGASYKLVEKIDLSLVGKEQIPVQLSE